MKRLLGLREGTVRATLTMPSARRVSEGQQKGLLCSREQVNEGVGAGQEGGQMGWSLDGTAASSLGSADSQEAPP